MRLIALAALLVMAIAGSSAHELLRVPLAKRRAPMGDVRLREGEGSVKLRNYLDAQVRSACLAHRPGALIFSVSLTRQHPPREATVPAGRVT